MNPTFAPFQSTQLAPGALYTVDANDSKEELGQVLGSSKSLKDLNIRSHDAGASNLAEVESVERIEALMAILTGQDARESHQKMRLLRETARHPQQLQHTLDAQGGATEQFLLLSGAILEGEREHGRSPAWETLRDARDRLWRTHGEVIRADINTAESFGPGAAGAIDRGVYKDAVLGEPTLSALLTTMLKTYGGDSDLEAAIKRFKGALGADLRALRSSVDPTRLRAVLRELSLMNVLAPLVPNFRQLVARLEIEPRRPLVGGTEAVMDVSAQLVADICPWLSKWVLQSDVHELLYRYRGSSSDPAADEDWKVRFLTGLAWLMRQVPSEAFASLQHYANIRDSLVAATDALLQIEPPPAQPTPGVAR